MGEEEKVPLVRVRAEVNVGWIRRGDEAEVQLTERMDGLIRVGYLTLLGPGAADAYQPVSQRQESVPPLPEATVPVRRRRSPRKPAEPVAVPVAPPEAQQQEEDAGTVDTNPAVEGDESDGQPEDSSGVQPRVGS